jgi:hypothetical protein
MPIGAVTPPAKPVYRSGILCNCSSLGGVGIHGSAGVGYLPSEGVSEWQEVCRHC